MRVETITSAQNPKIKGLLALQEKSRTRRAEGLFVVEGRRETAHCLSAGFSLRTVFYCPEIIYKDATASNAARFGDGPLNDVAAALEVEPSALAGVATLIELPSFLYDKVAYRGGTEGVIAEVEFRDLTLDTLEVGSDPLIVVLEGVEKPGNLGAVLRSADAAGADAVFICDPLTDLYNPNLIRASIGAVFTVPVVCCSSADAIAWLKDRGVSILTAQLQDSEWYYDTPMQAGTAIVIGTEATGLTDQWRQAADAHIKIPMLGRLDSLNASVSAAILLFEAVRQRQSRQ